MSRGKLVLWADSAFEAQVISSFLETSGYQVDNLAAPGFAFHQGDDFAAGIVVLDRWDAWLDQPTEEVRSLVGNPELPVIAIATKAILHGHVQRFLVRPILLFELVETVQEVIQSETAPPVPEHRLELREGER